MKRLLLVEDDELQARALQQTLSRDYQVHVAPTGEAGLVEATAFSPDLILLDVVMPGEYSGFDVLKRLKANPQTQHIPVVILTNLDIDHRDEALSKGATDYVRKTDMTIQQIRDLIHRYLPVR